MSFIIYFILITLIPIIVHFKLKRTYSKYSEIPISAQYTGAEVARKILDSKGLYNVKIEMVPGQLSDHYDPTDRTVRLSEGNYYGNSIAGAAVAAHEVGHAIQHAENYSFLTFRHKLVPVANIGSNLSWVFILIGALLTSQNLLLLGILFFSASVLFQFVTLPVEFNASNRAGTELIATGIIRNEEERGVKKVLNAAAMTYVAAAAIALMELLRFILSFIGMNNED